MGNTPTSGYCPAVAASNAPDFTPVMMAAGLVPALLLALPIACWLVLPRPWLRRVGKCVSMLDRRPDQVLLPVSLSDGGPGSGGGGGGGGGPVAPATASSTGVDVDDDGDDSDGDGDGDAGSGDGGVAGVPRARGPTGGQVALARSVSGGYLCLVLLYIAGMVAMYLWVAAFSSFHATVHVRPAPLFPTGELRLSAAVAFACPAHPTPLNAGELACTGTSGPAGVLATVAASNGSAATPLALRDLACTTSPRSECAADGSSLDGEPCGGEQCLLTWAFDVAPELYSSVTMSVLLPASAGYDRSDADAHDPPSDLRLMLSSSSAESTYWRRRTRASSGSSRTARWTSPTRTR